MGITLKAGLDAVVLFFAGTATAARTRGSAMLPLQTKMPTTAVAAFGIVWWRWRESNSVDSRG